MKDFYIADDDCMNLFEDIVQEEESCIIAPISSMKKIIFWILGEDDDADPGFIKVDTGYDAVNENESPYLLCYRPGVEFDLCRFDFSIKSFSGLIFVYDGLSCALFKNLDQESVIPFHYRSEDNDNDNDKSVLKVEPAKEETIKDTEIVTDDNGISGFTENITDGDGKYSSYSFYSTDRDLVENVANHRAEIIDLMTKRKE